MLHLSTVDPGWAPPEGLGPSEVAPAAMAAGGDGDLASAAAAGADRAVACVVYCLPADTQQ